MTSGFLYRRLASLIPCVFPGVGSGNLALKSKWEVASARDVFFSVHYWRLGSTLKTPPKVVVDLGAHCGHFLVLMHLLVNELFGQDVAEYFAVEANPALVGIAKRTVLDAGMDGRVKIFNALAGKKSGEGILNLQRHNLLTGTVEQASGQVTSQAEIPYLDLGSMLPADASIDVLKIDIEGSERDLIAEQPDFIRRASQLVVELHGSRSEMEFLQRQICQLGFEVVGPVMMKEDAMLVHYVNPRTHAAP
jgi:FkbM family methyltransferase